MSVVAAYVYKDGKRIRDASIDVAESLQIEDDEFIWVGLYEPTEAEFATLQETFHLHPLAVEDALNATQLPKVEAYGDQLFVLAKTAVFENDQIRYGETSAFVGRQHLITVRHGSNRAHGDLRQHLEAMPELLRHGVDYVLHGLLDYIVDGYLPIVEKMEDIVMEMERHALVAFLTREQVTRIFHLRRALMRFQRVLGPMDEVAKRLEHHEMPCIDNEIRPYFRDVSDHVQRVMAMTDGLREVLATVFEASNLLEQQRQGAITRQLAAWAAILAVPTAIAGIYGMNFDNLPELHWKYGYFAVLVVIGIVCALLYWRFKSVKWL